MAAVVITANNTRVEDAEALTGWTGIGGGSGASAEASFPYQGANLVNRKVTSSTGAGFAYVPTVDGGSAIDVTATQKTVMYKFTVSDYGGLQAANGIRVRQGSDGSNYYECILAGTSAAIPSATYPDRGGLVIMPLDVNVVAYRNATGGSPVLTAIDYFGILGAFAASTAKSENVGLDAIDIGTGLTLTGGDGGDADGLLQDFVDNDEGIVNNRYGYAFKLADNVHGAFGKWTLGSATATVVNDTSRQTIIFGDGLFAAGFSGLNTNLTNATSVINVSNKTFTSLGSTTTEDTRAVFESTGTSGASEWANNNFSNFASFGLTSAITFTGGAVINSGTMTTNGATVTDVPFNNPDTASGESALATEDLDLITNCKFTSTGTGHAVELPTLITTNDTMTWDNTASGYAATNGSTGNETILCNVNTGITLTINVAAGATTPSVHNTGAGTANVVAGLVTLTIEAPNGAEVRISQGSFTIQHTQEVVGGQVTYTYSFTPNFKVTLSVGGSGLVRQTRLYTLTNSDTSLLFDLEPNPSYI